MQMEEYDDDVFSLEEDLAREHRRQWVQYLVFAICAVLVIAAALYASVRLTERRIEDQAAARALAPVVTQTAVDPTDPTATPAPMVDTNFWPGSAFPTIPTLEAVAYDTELADGRAVVNVPAVTSRSFSAYIDKLVEAGAALNIRSTRLSVLTMDGVEIHLVSNNQRTQVVLCDEPASTWSDPHYSAFDLPEAGKLTRVEDGAGANSLVLTYRNATVHDALLYANALVQGGWKLMGSLEPENNTFLASYQKNNLQITVDYFSSTDAYQVKLDYLS